MKRIAGRDYTQEGPYDVMSREFLISRGFCCNSGCRNCPYKNGNENKIKIVSFVPSWTETLLAAGGNVIGCTRYCIHPKDLVRSCVKLGGTKSLDLPKIQDLKPDFVIMDKEENTKAMAESCPFPIIPSHIRSLEDLEKELKNLAHQLHLPELLSYSKRVNTILNKVSLNKKSEEIPGVLDWWRKPEQAFSDYSFIYLIWKNPFRCVTQNTYIGSILKALGFGDQLWAPQNRGLYPEFDLSEIPPKSILLFSSEPYPFAKYKETYLDSQSIHPAALLDGESFSWFGLRSLRFLEDHFYKK